MAKKKNICIDCPAYCCRDLSIPTKKPKNKHEIEEIKWYLHFNTVQVYIRSRRWYLLIKGKCMYLGKNNLCKIYDDRHQVCRDHTSGFCEINGDWYDCIFTSPDEIEKFFNKK